MIKVILLSQLLFLTAHCHGQNKIIYRAGNSTIILDITSGQSHQVDTTLYYNEKLVGVKVLGDSVKCHYLKSNEIFTKTYNISSIQNLPIKSKNKFVYVPKYNSYYKHNFYFKDYRFVTYNGGVTLLKGEEILWNTSKATPFNKNLDSINKPNNNSSMLYIDQHPILSPDEKYFLHTSYRYGFFPSWAKLYEVEMSTGQRQLISKDGYYYYPSYSEDGQYILYIGFSSGQFKIYDRKSKTNIFNYGLQDAFWLVE